MNAVLLPVAGAGPAALEAVVMDAVLLFSAEEQPSPPGTVLHPGKHLYQLRLDAGGAQFPLQIDRGGDYALFTQHHPDELRRRPTKPREQSRRWSAANTSRTTSTTRK